MVSREGWGGEEVAEVLSVLEGESWTEIGYSISPKSVSMNSHLLPK
jgi:hypothetical protein